MLNIAICDDNLTFLEEVTSLIGDLIPEKYCLVKFNEPQAMIDYVNENYVDIVITDIKMPEINGIQLAKKIKNIYPHINFIFITSYTEYVQDVFAVNPVYYVTKPVDKEKFREALTLALDRIKKSKGNTVSFISKYKTIRVRIDDIQYIESMNREIIFHLTDSKKTMIMKLDDVEKNLPSNFVRCHKSYLVNMNAIQEIANNKIILFSHESIPVAKTRFPDVKKQVLSYWGDML